jgi:hypothetical protein
VPGATPSCPWRTGLESRWHSVSRSVRRGATLPSVTSVSATYLRACGIGLLAAAGTAAIIGIPSDVIPNPWFTRKIGVDGFDVLVLVLLSVLTGALAVTYALARGRTVAADRAGLSSGIVGLFAISCPVCNKLVLALVGTAGATGWFASIQPLLGVVAIALATAALVVRVRAIRNGACELAAPLERPAPSDGPPSA